MGRARKEVLVRVKSAPLLKVLAQRNETLKQFSQKIEMSRSYVSQIVSGNRFPSPQVRERIQNELGVSFDDVFETVEREGINL